MKYAINGNLRNDLSNIINYKWVVKLKKLHDIINGLEKIHQQNLIHCDFHNGNILFGHNIFSITDLGLCKPVEYFKSTSKKKEIYGVLPFVAPEVLRGNPYTLASDIYSFSMIMWEFTSGTLPFNDRAHNFQLCLSICKGERPKIVKNVPQCYTKLMKRCWNPDPTKRPSVVEINNTIKRWMGYKFIRNINEISDEKLKNDIKEFWKADELFLAQANNQIAIKNDPIRKSHPQAYYTSRLLDFTGKLNETLTQEEKETIQLLPQTEGLGCEVKFYSEQD